MSSDHSLVEKWMLQHALIIILSAVLTYSFKIYWLLPLGAAFSFVNLFFQHRTALSRTLLFSDANKVSVFRLLLVLGLCLIPLSAKAIIVGGIGILILDGLDGYLARKKKQSTEFGAYLDAETDAFFVAVLSYLLWQQEFVGAWILLPGFLRYLYFVPVYFLKDPDAGEFRFVLAKYIAVIFMIGLLAAFIIPTKFITPMLGLTSLALLYSFGLSIKHGLSSTFQKQGWKLFVFGLGFLLANFLLFIPIYIGHLDVGMYELPDQVDKANWFSKLFYRTSNDPFRICTELTVFTLLLYYIRKHRPYFQILATLGAVFYVGLFLFQSYQAFYVRLYGVAPKMAADIVLSREVLPIFLSSVGGDRLFYYLSGFALICFFVLLFFLGYRFWTRSIKNLKKNFLIPTTLMGLVLFSIWSSIISPSSPQGVLRTGKSSFSNTAQWLSPKVVESIRFSNAERLWNLGRQLPYRDYWQYELREKPPVYLLFLESYGSVATIPEEAAPAYQALTDSLQQELTNDDWGIKSTYSRAPILGGRSWLSFTSTMCGTYIDNQIHYNNLLYSNPNYPHWPELMNRLGYDTYRMSTMKTNPKTDTLIPYEILDQFWKFDHFISFTDIPYKGYPYDFYGGIPDQYALGHFRDSLLTDSGRPHFLFFITMSSHTPWYPSPLLLENYQDLDDIKDSPYGTDRALKGDKMDRYLDAIRYQLETTVKFIKEGPEDAIYILLGDHQPGALEYKLWGLFPDDTTPFHVISKDSTFLSAFAEFDSGFQIDTVGTPIIRHEAIYSNFMNRFMQTFGADVGLLPEIQESGIAPPELK